MPEFETNEEGQEKSEFPTDRRRKKAREKGSVARSKEVNTAVLLFCFVFMSAVYGPHLVRSLVEFIRYSFIHFTEVDLTQDNFISFAVDTFVYFLKLVLPFLLVMMLVGVVANLAQFGWLWTTNTIFQGFKGFSLNPMKAVKKIFDKSNFVKLGINILKLAILSLVLYSTLKKEIWKFPQLIELPLFTSLQYMLHVLFILSIKVCVLLIFIAVIDFLWEKHKHEKSLKMTKQEVKDEKKQVEGDPKMRSKIRGIMQRAAMERMMHNVPKADVVITNPVHVAVAIQYDRENMAAPEVVAKGARLIAEKIKDIARSASVPVIENRMVAQTLFKTVEVGEAIPPKLYQTVAEILAYIYQLNDAKKARAGV